MPLGLPGLPGKFLSQWLRLKTLLALWAIALHGNPLSRWARPTPLLALRAVALLCQLVPRDILLRNPPLGLPALPGRPLLRQLPLKVAIYLRVVALLCQRRRPRRPLTR